MSKNSKYYDLDDEQKAVVAEYVGSISKNKYSRLQYFFWLLSGAEISLLKNCPTDYNKQAGIGFTIFMTTVLALFSGSYAGYYFSDNIFSSLIFGIVWASLIFSIDRSMVVTLKKDPTLKKQNFFKSFISRAILALLIAFIISIPLELLIFKENIELHMDKYKLDQTYQIKNAVIRNEDISIKINQRQRDSISLSQVGSQLAIGEPTGDPKYSLLISKLTSKQNDYNILQKNYNTASYEANRAYNNVPYIYNRITEQNEKNSNSYEWGIFQKKLNYKQQELNQLNKFNKKELAALKNEKIAYITHWDDSLKTLKSNFNNKILKTELAIDKSRDAVDSTGGNFSEKISDKKGFVLRFMVLEDLANPRNPDAPEGKTIFFLLWLIRIIFFTIEILPTISKIITPIGAYDIALKSKENELEFELEERTNTYLKQKTILRDMEYAAEQEQLMERTKIENNLHKTLLEEIADVQNQIARHKIEEFKIKNLK